MKDIVLKDHKSPLKPLSPRPRMMLEVIRQVGPIKQSEIGREMRKHGYEYNSMDLATLLRHGLVERDLDGIVRVK